MQKELQKFNFNMETIRLFDSFAGIGALHQALKELGVPVQVVGLSEIDVDAIISYAGVHELDLESVPLKSIDEMREYLMERNIGYSFEKDKKLCNHCGKYNYKNDAIKFKYCLSELLKEVK